MELDFSGFHDLLHRPFTRECRSQPGGWRRHLRLEWEYRRRDQVVGIIRRPLCWVGRHEWQVWKLVRGPGLEAALAGREVSAPSDYRGICRYCPASRTATEDEWW